jgi:hypothetical protein
MKSSSLLMLFSQVGHFQDAVCLCTRGNLEDNSMKGELVMVSYSSLRILVLIVHSVSFEIY